MSLILQDVWSVNVRWADGRNGRLRVFLLRNFGNDLEFGNFVVFAGSANLLLLLVLDVDVALGGAVLEDVLILGSTDLANDPL